MENCVNNFNLKPHWILLWKVVEVRFVALTSDLQYLCTSVPLYSVLWFPGQTINFKVKLILAIRLVTTGQRNWIRSVVHKPMHTTTSHNSTLTNAFNFRQSLQPAVQFDTAGCLKQLKAPNDKTPSSTTATSTVATTNSADRTFSEPLWGTRVLCDCSDFL